MIPVERVVTRTEYIPVERFKFYYSERLFTIQKLPLLLELQPESLVESFLEDISEALQQSYLELLQLHIPDRQQSAQLLLDKQLMLHQYQPMSLLVQLMLEELVLLEELLEEQLLDHQELVEQFLAELQPMSEHHIPQPQLLEEPHLLEEPKSLEVSDHLELLEQPLEPQLLEEQPPLIPQESPLSLEESQPFQESLTDKLLEEESLMIDFLPQEHIDCYE